MTLKQIDLLTTELPYYILFILQLILLAGAMRLYLHLAKDMGMVAIPGARSSHAAVTLKGAGVIIPISFLILWIFDREVSGVLMAGVLMCSFIGFYDDLRGLGVGVRLLVQAVACILFVYYELPDLPIYMMGILVIILIGSVNVYNFMDGINGMLVGYSTVTLLSLLWIDHREGLEMAGWLYSALAAVWVFGYYNFRSTARCFAGDVGSLSMGFLIAALLMWTIYRTEEYSYVMLMVVYYIDAGITIIQRLWKGENILQAHRFHLYEILGNERKIPHLKVATLYLSIQGLLNVYTLFIHPLASGHIDLIGIVTGLVLIYLVVKRKVIGD